MITKAALYLLAAATAFAAPSLPTQYSIAQDPSADRLDMPVEFYRVDNQPITKALSVLGRTYRISFIADPDISGTISFEINNGTLRDVLTALTEPSGYFWEKSGQSFAIRRTKTVNYLIDYPQGTRSGSASSSVTVSGTRAGSGGSQSGTGSIATAGSAGQGGSAGAQGASGGSDNTSIQITQTNQNTFWQTIESELRAMLVEGEKLVMNKFSGIAQISASPKRHEVLREFITTMNSRINQQVAIEAKIYEVSLNKDRKLGIDWFQAQTSAGGLTIRSSSTLTDLTSIGGNILPGDAFSASISAGKLSALIRALSDQGEVRAVSQPSIRTLNNQPAVVKVGVDRVFFSLASSTVINQPGTGTGFSTSQDVYSQNNVTIGTVLSVTPQVSSDGSITLDVMPALTRLNSIATSPDNKQTAPNTEVKTASTIVRLKDGETAMIGGLIFESDSTSTKGVPGLENVPVIGRAFRTDVSTKSRTELVIFLTAHVVKG